MTWQWAHLRFCSLYSCVLHIFVSLVVLSLILAYALVLSLVVFHGLQGLHRGICTCGLRLSLPQFQLWENRAWWWSRFKEPLCSFSIVQLIQTAALIRRPSYDTDSPPLTRSTYLSDHGLCADLPVYKHPVFRQSSPKLDLIININVLESLPCASPFAHLLHNPLRVVSSNTRDFYLFKYSPPVHLLVQVVLSRPVEALTHGEPELKRGSALLM